MNTTLIVLTSIFTVLFLIVSRINKSKENRGYFTDFDFFWLRYCLIFREGESLLLALAWLSSFFLVVHTGWGPPIWMYWSVCSLLVNLPNIQTNLHWYKNLCWKEERKRYLATYILSVFSNGIWILIILISVSKFVMFVLEAEPWNR